MTKSLNELRDEALRIATEHGFTDASVGEDIALMKTELAEAFEDYMAGYTVNETYYHAVERPVREDSPPRKPCGVPSELADCIIRILHFCGKHKIDIEAAVTEKMAYNETRPFKHGGKKI